MKQPWSCKEQRPRIAGQSESQKRRFPSSSAISLLWISPWALPKWPSASHHDEIALQQLSKNGKTYLQMAEQKLIRWPQENMPTCLLLRMFVREKVEISRLSERKDGDPTIYTSITLLWEDKISNLLPRQLSPRFSPSFLKKQILKSTVDSQTILNTW